jgi:copper ion binding protein
VGYTEYPVRVSTERVTMTVRMKTYDVIGMTCDHCVRSVRDEIGRIPGVKRVEVDLATGKVTVESDRPVDDQAVAAAVDEAGYQVAS